MDDFEPAPDPSLPTPPIKGRGAAANVVHRFSSETRQAEDDGWLRDPAAAPRTRLHVDTAKSVITMNDSPDLAFDRSANPYRGCEHGCIYCYARPTHAWLGLSPGLDFETEIFHKPDAPARLREELARPGYRPATLALGTATDIYQPCERDIGLTRRLLEVLLETRHPVSIVTKGALIERDVDLLAEMARLDLVRVCFSLTTLQGELARQLEPRASAPPARLRAMATLHAAGVPVSLFVAPLIPGLTDHELEKLLAAGHEHGADSAMYTLLRLPHEVAGLFRQWLEAHAPEKAARIMAVLYDLRGGKANDARFGSRFQGLGHFAELLRQRFELHCRRLGLSTRPSLPDASRFSAPTLPPTRPDSGQLSLF